MSTKPTGVKLTGARHFTVTLFQRHRSFLFFFLFFVNFDGIAPECMYATPHTPTYPHPLHTHMLSNGWTKYAKMLFGSEGGEGVRRKMTESLGKRRGSGWHNHLYLSLMRQLCLAGFYWSSSSHRLEPSVQPFSMLVDRILAPLHRLPGWKGTHTLVPWTGTVRAAEHW